MSRICTSAYLQVEGQADPPLQGGSLPTSLLPMKMIRGNVHCSISVGQRDLLKSQDLYPTVLLILVGETRESYYEMVLNDVKNVALKLYYYQLSTIRADNSQQLSIFD